MSTDDNKFHSPFNVPKPASAQKAKPEKPKTETSYQYPIHFTASEEQQQMLDELVAHYRKLKTQGKMTSYSKASVMRDALEAHWKAVFNKKP